MLFAQEESGGFVIKIFPERQKERKASRWSLASWMKTKEQIAEQNRWLWAHTNKVPVEWALSYTQSTQQWATRFDIFLARLGLTFHHERFVSWFADETEPGGHQTELAAQIRLFGGNLQDSYLMARIGYEYSEFALPSSLSGGAYGAWFVEPVLQLYLEQWIGATGSWKYRYTGAHGTRKTEQLSGTRLEMGPFLEMGALRIHALYQVNSDSFSLLASEINRQQWALRLKLHY